MRALYQCPPLGKSSPALNICHSLGFTQFTWNSPLERACLCSTREFVLFWWWNEFQYTDNGKSPHRQLLGLPRVAALEKKIGCFVKEWLFWNEESKAEPLSIIYVDPVSEGG